MTGFEQKDGADQAVLVPYGEVSAEALQGLAEAFVLREGTEYGEHSYSLEKKVRHVIDQLERGEAVIVCEPNSGAVDIMLKRELSRAKS